MDLQTPSRDHTGTIRIFPDFKDEYFGSSRALKVVFARYFRALSNIQGPQMNFWGVEKLSIMFSRLFCNSRNFQRSIWSGVTAVVEFGMVLPHFVREPALEFGKICASASSTTLSVTKQDSCDTGLQPCAPAGCSACLLKA